MTLKSAAIVLGLGLIVFSAPVVAHHSFAAEYDAKKPIDVMGVVTKVEWTNPHARFYVDVADASGAKVNWNFELASPNVLIRSGWKRTSLKIGDQVSVHGFRAKDGGNMANAASVVLSDGTKVFAGSSADGTPQY